MSGVTFSSVRWLKGLKRVVGSGSTRDYLNEIQTFQVLKYIIKPLVLQFFLINFILESVNNWPLMKYVESENVWPVPF